MYNINEQILFHQEKKNETNIQKLSKFSWTISYFNKFHF